MGSQWKIVKSKKYRRKAMDVIAVDSAKDELIFMNYNDDINDEVVL